MAVVPVHRFPHLLNIFNVSPSVHLRHQFDHQVFKPESSPEAATKPQRLVDLGLSCHPQGQQHTLPHSARSQTQSPPRPISPPPQTRQSKYIPMWLLSQQGTPSIDPQAPSELYLWKPYKGLYKALVGPETRGKVGSRAAQDLLLSKMRPRNGGRNHRPLSSSFLWFICRIL